MDAVLLESSAVGKSPGFGCRAGGAYESLLKDSIDRFLGEIRRGTCDLSGLHSVFFRLLQSRVDPPLEVVWFYSAVSHYGNFSSTKEVSGRVSAARDLLQLLAACSASCGGKKSIALLAPFVYELRKITLEIEKSREEFSRKELKKLRKEIYLLAEGVTSYISICSSKNCGGKHGSECLAPCFVDLVGIWTARWADGGDALQEFFPLVNDEIRNAFRNPGCEVRYLSGVVITEAFLAMLRLKLQKAGATTSEARSELKIWLVGSVTAFRSHELFEFLLTLLLDGALPSSLFLTPVDESFLRDVLYDSVILVDYSFLYPEKREEDPSSFERLYVGLLLVTHQAVQAARERGDQAKLTAYMNAFSRSALPSALTQLIADKLGAEKPGGKTSSSSPEALLKWLLTLEDRGYKAPKFDLSGLRSALFSKEIKTAAVARRSDGMDDEDMFLLDNKGYSSGEEEADEEEMETVGGLFLSAARSMKPTAREGRKRKGSKGRGDRGSSARLVKYSFHSRPGLSSPEASEVSGESDVENPPSGEEMEDCD